MKVFRKGLGLILGCLMAISMIGCSNKIEQGEKLLKENIQEDIKRNIEEYQPKYNELDIYNQSYLRMAKIIDKIDVDIEELDDTFEAKVTLGYEGCDIEDLNDVFVLEIEKDKLTKENLENEDFLYSQDNLKKVVAHKMTYREKNGELIIKLYCEEGYDGHTKDEYSYENENENKTVMIFDNWQLEKDFLLCLGDLAFNI